MTSEFDTAALIQKLREWSARPEITAHNWAPRLFWQPGSDSPYDRLRVDAAELEVYFAALLDEPSVCRAFLDRTQNGRGGFLVANARRHELPLFSRIDQDGI